VSRAAFTRKTGKKLSVAFDAIVAGMRQQYGQTMDTPGTVVAPKRAVRIPGRQQHTNFGGNACP
jgi:hypothetical protein